MLHLDRRIRYANISFRKRLKKYRMSQSMSGSGNGYDNTMIDLFQHPENRIDLRHELR